MEEPAYCLELPNLQRFAGLHSQLSVVKQRSESEKEGPRGCLDVNGELVSLYIVGSA